MSLDSGAGGGVSGSAATPKTIEELNMEVERLTRELDQATSERAQSAQYGLSLLEEKSSLEQRLEELETLYDNAKHELDITHEVSQLLHCSFCLISKYLKYFKIFILYIKISYTSLKNV